MLKISLLVLAGIITCPGVALPISFDATEAASLPEGAEVIAHGRAATVELEEGKLKLTTGTPAGSAFAALRLLPKEGTAAASPRVVEVVLDLDKLSRRVEAGFPALWAGLISSRTERADYFFLGGKWLGAVVELRETPNGQYAIVLRERWEMVDSPECPVTSGRTGDAAYYEICTLSGLPRQLKVRFEDGRVAVTVDGVEIAAIAPTAQRTASGVGVQQALEPEMTGILEGDVEPVLGLSNFGDLQEPAVALLKGFSISE